ncbi:hypothetical protein Micbo1qcDRAFT_155323, partial [Microdochium bolleyi]
MGGLDLSTLAANHNAFATNNALPLQPAALAEMPKAQPSPTQALAAQPAPVFAKPELKHARSSIKEEEERRQADHSKNR